MSFTRNNLDRRSAALVLLACGGLITACSSMAQDHSSRSAAQAASSPTTVTTITNPGNGTNRITVSGNTAGSVVVDCAPGRTARADVNSVRVDGAALKGKTVIVSGRNSGPVSVRGDCVSGTGSDGGVSVNSVTIR